MASTSRRVTSGALICGLVVVGGNVGTRHEYACLSALGVLSAAIEEEGDMRVLLGLGDVELCEVVLGEDVGQYVLRELLGEGHRSGNRGVVLGEADETHAREHGAFEPLERGVSECACDLTCAVRPEVEEDDSVAIGDPYRSDHRRNHELVVHACLVGGSNHCGRVVCGDALAEHHRLPGPLHPVPPIVAVHGVVAAHDRRDPSGSEFGR